MGKYVCPAFFGPSCNHLQAANRAHATQFTFLDSDVPATCTHTFDTGKKTARISISVFLFDMPASSIIHSYIIGELYNSINESIISKRPQYTATFSSNLFFFNLFGLFLATKSNKSGRGVITSE